MNEIIISDEMKPVWELWFWINKIETNGFWNDDKNDKHLINKIEKIMPLLEKFDSEWKKDDCALDEYVKKAFDDEKKLKRFHIYDLVKGVIHNDILRKNNLEPLSQLI